MKIACYHSSHDITGKIIQFFSRGEYNHTSVVLNDGTLIEAYPFRRVSIRKTSTDGIKNSRVDIFEVETTIEQDIIIKDFLTKQIGKKYDYLAVLGFVIYTTKEERKQKQKWDCSELVFAAFQKAGINLLERISAWQVSPVMISISPKLIYVNSIYC